MASVENTELAEAFETFYRQHYSDEIADLAKKYPSEKKSLEIDWEDISLYDPDLGDDVIESPGKVISAAEDALSLYDLAINQDLEEAHVRIYNLPFVTDIREIRSNDLGNLISVQGIVRKATSVKPKILNAAFQCLRCDTINEVPQSDGGFQEPYQCRGCERDGPYQFKTGHEMTEFVDAQKLRIQESPEGLGGGETPESIDMHIEDDITGEVSPGDHVTATGILRLDDSDMDSTDSRVFDMYLEGVSVTVEDEEFEEMEISAAEREEIVRLSEQPDVYERIVDSIAPTIYGFEVAKLAIALQLFSGVTKHLPDGARIRGDVHILLVGDPGTGKSQILQYIRHISPRSVYTSGKGSSSAGLTAAAVRDDFGDGQQWSLEAGALVLADKGVAAVDELDKMACVTGDTLVSLAGGEIERIGELAHQAAADGSIEVLENGRTIRDLPELSVRTMTEDGSIEERPVTAIHEYDAPSDLCDVTLETGESLTATPDHPFIVLEDGDQEIQEAASLEPGSTVFVPPESMAVTDGGSVSSAESESRVEGSRDMPVETATVESVSVRARETFADSPQSVYDLTVEGTHNFVANGMVVHNSDDRSAMHEALEQQSYHPGTEILLADGRRVEIGEFVDEKMAAREDEIVDGVDCEILPVEDAAVHSTDLESRATTKLPVDRVSRHEAPDEFVRVTFSNGRDVTVTPDHPMFVAEGGAVDTVDATEIEPGDFVPAPRKLPNSSATVDLDSVDHQGKERDVDLPDELSENLAEILGLIVAEGHTYAGSAHEIGFSNKDERLLDRMAELMDAEFGFESTDTTNEAGTITQRWVSTKLYRWFQQNVPEVMHTARKKRIPDIVLGASEEHIRRFLVGAFAGDGGVESEAMAFSTASEDLAQDYADALSKIGVASRIHYNSTEDSWKTYVMGDSTERFVETVVTQADDRYQKAQRFVERSNAAERHHDVLPTDAAREIRSLRTLVGLPKTGKFRPNLDNGFGVRGETVESEVSEIRDQIESVRNAVAEADGIGEIRAAASWSGRQLATRLDGETSSSIHYAESGGYDSERRRDIASRARDAILAAMNEAENRAEELASRTELRFYRVTDVETIPNEGEHATDWVYDVTVEPTNTFVSQGVILHNSISISKAGINATLKSRCALLGAANPELGRFDRYETPANQIDLEPALISRFDLIFTVTDQPDAEKDANLAEHILNTNYAGELNTHRTQVETANVSAQQVEDATRDVAPEIEPGLMRKYIAYARSTCFPTMTEEAESRIRDFYVNLRSQGTGEDSPVPVTARKLEAIVRLAEASARVRLSDTVEPEDADRALEIVDTTLKEIGMDPETGQYDADVIETGQSKTQRDRIRTIKELIEDVESEFDEGAPVDEILARAEEIDMDRSKAEHEIEKLKQQGEVYEPSTGHLRTT